MRLEQAAYTRHDIIQNKEGKWTTRRISSKPESYYLFFFFSFIVKGKLCNRNIIAGPFAFLGDYISHRLQHRPLPFPFY